MGAASSRFAETDWDKNDGCCPRDATLDGSAPTLSHTILTLKKTKSLVNQREFEVRNDQDLLLYKSVGVEGTTKEFELFAVASNSTLFRVIPDSDHSNWTVYGHNRIFEGQVPSKDNRWYKTAIVHIAWDHCHGDVHMMVPGDDPSGVPGDAILKVETIKSITAQYQAFRPSASPSILHPPLTAHWVWEHTEHSHQLKMHLSKGCDVAMHTLLVIITNLVTVEQKAKSEK